MSEYLKYQIGDVVGEVHFVRSSLRPHPRPLRTPVKNPSWYVVATNPKCEEKAKTGLEDLGYATFLPTETVWARVPKHRQKEGQPKKVKVTRPLFPGYLFVGKEAVHSFEPARLTDGVYSFIMNGSEYLALPTKAINEMIEQQERGDHDKTIKAAERLAELIGKQITVPEGHLAGFVATIRKATEKGAECVVTHNGKRITVRLGLETLQGL